MNADKHGFSSFSQPGAGLGSELHFGKYAVLERIGTGGMAEIFKCRLSGIGGFDKAVVVKRILPDNLSEPDFINMFLDEARVAANLCHPNIVQTYEIDEIDGIPYIAMEYVRGLTFGALIKASKGRDPRRRMAVAAKVMAGVCEGLYSAHNAVDSDGQPLQLVHRDVSPHNILISLEGIPKLADFGVAKAKGQISVTKTGTLKGKYKYMAPEQFARGMTIDHRVDIFSAGVCLYLATTGRLPYRGDTEIDVIRAAAAGLFPLPSELVEGFPEDLERIILWAMAPDPGDRCSDCHQLAQALEGFVLSGDHACTTQLVAEEVRELFEQVEGSHSRSGYTPSTGGETWGSPARGIRDLGLEVAAQSSGEEGSEILTTSTPWPAWLALAGLAAGVLYLAFAPLGRPDLTPPPSIRNPVPGPVAATPKQDPVISPAAAPQIAVEPPTPKPVVAPVKRPEPDRNHASASAPAKAKPPPPKQVKRTSPPPPAPTPKKAAPAKDPPAKASEAVAETAAPIEAAFSAPPSEAVPAEPAPPPPAPSALAPSSAGAAPVAAKDPGLSPPEAPSTTSQAPQASQDEQASGCPEGAKWVGAAPPQGFELSCQLPTGVKHGHATEWYANGRKAQEGEYRHGKKNGRWIEWYESGGERERTEWRKGVKAW